MFVQIGHDLLFDSLHSLNLRIIGQDAHCISESEMESPKRETQINAPKM